MLHHYARYAGTGVMILFVIIALLAARWLQ